ncbi:Catalytics isoform 1 [Hibiscus syriacus]|uniref:Catalytics isoform 1 n=1 Tax=Hibiscus syriacus TaxID=106335 RepID=A0A6A2YBP7_HIBSY|nr:Catalytics isoform 1 [Hibiscus syriacus]
MKTKHHHSKLKTQPRPLFSCGFFRNSTQSTISPTTPHSPPLPLSSSQQPPASPSPPSVLTHPSPPPPPLPPPKNSLQQRWNPPLPPLLLYLYSMEIPHPDLLERSLVPKPPSDPVCSPELMRGIVSNLKNNEGVKPVTKILLALCLVRAHALAVPVMVSVMGRLAVRGREYAISVIPVIYGVGCDGDGNGNGNGNGNGKNKMDG